MTIAHLVVSNSFGGVEGHICTLIKLLQNTDYKFIVVCNKGVEEKFRDKLSGYEVEFATLNLKPGFGVTQYRKLKQLFRKLKPDLVHCHLYSATRTGAIPAKTAGVDKVIETIHIEEIWRAGFKKFLFCGIDSVIGRLFVDHYIAVSDSVSLFYQKNKWVPKEKISTIHNTTELSGITIESNKTFSKTLGFLGRLVHQKGLDVLLESILLLKVKGLNWNLKIGGSGPLLKELQQQARDMGIEKNVTFLGNVSDRDRFFNEIDVFVLPSRYEGFPLVLVEAGMYEMPVVTTNVSGNPEIIQPGKTGVLVKSEDSESLAQGIEEYSDEQKRNMYSANLKKLINQEFSKERYTEKMNKFYHSLLGKG